MSRPATDRLKLNPPLGMLPALQYLLPAQLKIDATYQRSLDTDAGKALVRRIAQHWNWDLCQPLVVSRRADGALYVIDGQHRLAAARLRGDIAQLPAVVVQYASAADEAASFVHLNQERTPLTKLDLFKAALASGDSEALAIVEALGAAGLMVAPHNNFTAWKPGMVSNIGGIEGCWRRRGAGVTRLALQLLAAGFDGQVLRYAGSLFPGVAAIAAAEIEEGQGPESVDATIREMVAELLGSRSQTEWRNAIMQARGANPNLRFAAASEEVLISAWVAHVEAELDGPAASVPAAAVSEHGGPDAVEPDADESDAVESDEPDDVLAVSAFAPTNEEAKRDKAPAAQRPAGSTGPSGLPVAANSPRGAPAAAPKVPAPTPLRTARKAPLALDLRTFSSGKPPAKIPFKADAEGKAWCRQCDRRRSAGEVRACKDPFCVFESAPAGRVGA